MGGSDCCARIILAIINTFFFLLSLLFLAVGIISFVGQSLFQPLLQTTLGVAEAAAEAGNGTDTGEIAGATALVGELFKVIEPISIAFIAIGVFLLIVTIMGMCGACCSVKCMLVTYVVLVLLVFIAHLVVFICLMLGVFTAPVQGVLKSWMTKNYTDVDSGKGGSGISQAWNLMMIYGDCCGIVDYTDFNDTKWDREVLINNVQKLKVTPLACCVNMNGTEDYDYDKMCAVKPTDINNNWKTGCWEIYADEYFEPNNNVIIGVTCGFLGFELVLVALAICVIVMKDRDERKIGD